MEKQYYSLGLYIHECPKMHYKLQFHPAYVLCHTTRMFIDEKTAKPYIEQHSLCLDPEGTAPQRMY